MSNESRVIVMANGIKRINIDIPRRPEIAGRRAILLVKILHDIYIFLGVALLPLIFLIAALINVPGLSFRMFWLKYTLSDLFFRKYRGFRDKFKLILIPMDSVRYFEFGFFYSLIHKKKLAGTLLDVSSPRLFPLYMLIANKGLSAVFINPDASDIAETKSFADVIRIRNILSYQACVIDDCNYSNKSFDYITCISVIEHIQDDRSAVQKMWELLKPGGTLFLSVPCCKEEFDEYFNINVYGVLEADSHGYTFHQRYYSEDALQKNIFSITGPPVRYSIAAEKKPGWLNHNREDKIMKLFYPAFLEPLLFQHAFTTVHSINQMPGCGVITMELVKRV